MCVCVCRGGGVQSSDSKAFFSTREYHFSVSFFVCEMKATGFQLLFGLVPRPTVFLLRISLSGCVHCASLGVNFPSWFATPIHNSVSVTCKASLPTWINNSVRRAISKRNKARNLAKRSNMPSAWATFRRLRNLVVSTICKAQRSFFSLLTSSPSNFWKMPFQAQRSFFSLLTSSPSNFWKMPFQ